MPNANEGKEEWGDEDDLEEGAAWSIYEFFRNHPPINDTILEDFVDSFAAKKRTWAIGAEQDISPFNRMTFLSAMVTIAAECPTQNLSKTPLHWLTLVGDIGRDDERDFSHAMTTTNFCPRHFVRRGKRHRSKRTSFPLLIFAFFYPEALMINTPEPALNRNQTILHLCKNPRCVAPSHLVRQTSKDEPEKRADCNGNDCHCDSVYKCLNDTVVPDAAEP